MHALFQEEYDQKWASLSARLEFDYDASSVRRGKPDFSVDDVKGVVARLVKVKDMGTATALEAAAGGKLYSVVVDCADTGTASRGWSLMHDTELRAHDGGTWAGKVPFA